MQSAPRDGSLSISFTEWANEECLKDMSGVEERDNKERTQREEEEEEEEEKEGG